MIMHGNGYDDHRPSTLPPPPPPPPPPAAACQRTEMKSAVIGLRSTVGKMRILLTSWSNTKSAVQISAVCSRSFFLKIWELWMFDAGLSASVRLEPAICMSYHCCLKSFAARLCWLRSSATFDRARAPDYRTQLQFLGWSLQSKQ